MNETERLQLQKMCKEHNVEDNTELIRNLKHSKPIWADVNTILSLKKTHAKLEQENAEEFSNLCINKANFLFNAYTDIFNKVVKNEINFDTLLELLNVLKAIEEGACDQHEGSFEVGKLLKKIYIDSALIKQQKLDAEDKQETAIETNIEEPMAISWAEYKKKQQ